MTQLKVTDSGDIEVEGNTFSLIDKDAEIRQRIIQNLKTFLGEWFLDVNTGVPYYQIIFEKGVSAELVEDSIKDAILSTIGVVELTRFEPLDLDGGTRLLAVDFEVRTVNGVINISEEL